MSNANYRIMGNYFSATNDKLNDALASVYGTKNRPYCMCTHDGVEMYVAKIAGRYVVKRMPNKGNQHTSACDSYEAPPELSGLGQVMGTAIQENAEEGITSLKFDFSLTKSGTRNAPEPTGIEHGSVKADTSKLTLRATLHYLWGEAGFNKWSPHMEGKRSWTVIRKFLIQAAENKKAKGASLADILYVPESFNLDKKRDIDQRRMAHLSRASSPQKGGKKLMLVVGEVKEIGDARFGKKIVLKHLPDFHFMMPDETHKKVIKRFENELNLTLADEHSKAHLIMIATFSVNDAGYASIEEVALMPTTEQWIPFENNFEKSLIEALIESKRRFAKGQRYNLQSTQPLACAVLNDTQPEATALYVVPPSPSEDYTLALTNMINESDLTSWVWKCAEGTMPPLPTANHQ